MSVYTNSHKGHSLTACDFHVRLNNYCVFLLTIYLFCFLVWEFCPNLCRGTMCMPTTLWGQKRALDTLELELWMVACHSVCWKPNLYFLQGQQVLLTPESSFKPLFATDMNTSDFSTTFTAKSCYKTKWGVHLWVGVFLQQFLSSLPSFHLKNPRLKVLLAGS